jgi:DNA-binding GntR family transcriptional regulator
MRQPSITDLSRQYLEKAIFSGELSPGEQIKEDHVAEVLKISRPPLREAFKLLEAEGLVVRKPRRGVFVTKIDAHDAWEIYTLKAELYEFSIRLAFDLLSRKEIERMGRLVQAMEKSVHTEPSNYLSYQKLNVRFHDLHIDAARHKRLKQHLRVLHKQVMYYSHKSLANLEHLERSLGYHQKIYQAFKEGNQDLAIQFTRDHVLAGLKEISTGFQESLTKTAVG